MMFKQNGRLLERFEPEDKLRKQTSFPGGVIKNIYIYTFNLLGPPAKRSLFMDQQIHQHLFLPSEQKSEQLFLTCNINNLIYFLLRATPSPPSPFPPLLRLLERGLHAVRSPVCVWGEM